MWLIASFIAIPVSFHDFTCTFKILKIENLLFRSWVKILSTPNCRLSELPKSYSRYINWKLGGFYSYLKKKVRRRKKLQLRFASFQLVVEITRRGMKWYEEKVKNENEARLSPVSKSILINRAKTHQQLATANFLAIHAHSRATHLPPIYPQFSPTPTESLLARFTRGAKLHENGGWMRIPVLSHNRKRSSSDTSDKAIHWNRWRSPSSRLTHVRKQRSLLLLLLVCSRTVSSLSRKSLFSQR